MEAHPTGGGGSTLVDWLGGESSDVRTESVSAVGSNAAFALGKIADGVPVNRMHEVIDEVLDRAELVMGTTSWGVGIELGAGSAYASAALSKRPGVERVYALEHSSEYAVAVMPALFESVGADLTKLVRVIGSFNEIRLPDGSLDFAIAIGALHHSEDLPRTLAEAARVLRPGGHLVAVERYQPDGLTHADLDALLDVTIAPELAARYGFVDGRRVTRRELGEHELRLSEWKVRLWDAGFEPFPFMGVDFSGRKGYALLSVPWRGLLGLAGDRLFLGRCRWQLLGSQIPFDLRWLFRTKGPTPINLFLVARKGDSDG